MSFQTMPDVVSTQAVLIHDELTGPGRGAMTTIHKTLLIAVEPSGRSRCSPPTRRSLAAGIAFASEGNAETAILEGSLWGSMHEVSDAGEIEATATIS
jgi:hypothetical protein